MLKCWWVSGQRRDSNYDNHTVWEASVFSNPYRTRKRKREKSLGNVKKRYHWRHVHLLTDDEYWARAYRVGFSRWFARYSSTWCWCCCCCWCHTGHFPITMALRRRHRFFCHLPGPRLRDAPSISHRGRRLCGLFYLLVKWRDLWCVWRHIDMKSRVVVFLPIKMRRAGALRCAASSNRFSRRQLAER